MIWDGINQRRFPRVNYKCLIRISKEEQEKVIETYTENIGAGGICVAIEEEFKLFDTVSLDVYLGEDDKPVSCNATIVWVVTRRPASEHEKITYDTGIEFANISDEERERVSQLVDEIIKTEA